jgi:hypothetical protein
MKKIISHYVSLMLIPLLLQAGAANATENVTITFNGNSANSFGIFAYTLNYNIVEEVSNLHCNFNSGDLIQPWSPAWMSQSPSCSFSMDDQAFHDDARLNFGYNVCWYLGQYDWCAEGQALPYSQALPPASLVSLWSSNQANYGMGANGFGSSACMQVIDPTSGPVKTQSCSQDGGGSDQVAPPALFTTVAGGNNNFNEYLGFLPQANSNIFVNGCNNTNPPTNIAQQSFTQSIQNVSSQTIFVMVNSYFVDYWIGTANLSGVYVIQPGETVSFQATSGGHDFKGSGIPYCAPQLEYTVYGWGVNYNSGYPWLSTGTGSWAAMALGSRNNNTNPPSAPPVTPIYAGQSNQTITSGSLAIKLNASKNGVIFLNNEAGSIRKKKFILKATAPSWLWRRH